MSTAELQQTADRLTVEERAWMRRYLALLDRISDPAFVAEVTNRNRTMAAGDFLTREEVLALHEKLVAQGR